MSATPWHAQIVPAQLSFLAFYNPFLGLTDDTFRDQLVFYFSRDAHEARTAAKKTGRNDSVGGDALREQENERLRQIGLAQGMVDFAKTFSNHKPVNSIETEKSRIVLLELEQGWWILASIDLTRLPLLSDTSAETSKKASGEKLEPKASVEYSSREVSPPALLLEQLREAHRIFSLHHGPSLNELFIRLSRDRFCSTLSRFWSRFCRSWNVLLHANPAVDILGALKLASGGELGFGVGEEEWGSGEREVLEDLASRTEGLVDLVVSRFGESETDKAEGTSGSEDDPLPWMGMGNQPAASDGVIFGGLNAISRSSLGSLSIWMRQMYTYGDHAYGVRDNPLRERRKRRRHHPPQEAGKDTRSSRRSAPLSVDGNDSTNLRAATQLEEAQRSEITPSHPAVELLRKDERPQIHPRVASQDYASTPEETPIPSLDGSRMSIPPPIITATEEALQKATREADKHDDEERQRAEDSDPGTTMGIPDEYMKYLTFGLSTLGKQRGKQEMSHSRKSSAAITQGSVSHTVRHGTSQEYEEKEGTAMTHLEPMPDGETAKSRFAMQMYQENKGYFLIGLRGDLDSNNLVENEDVDLTDGSLCSSGSRIVLRTLHIEMAPTTDSVSGANASNPSLDPTDSEPVGTPPKNFQRLRVLIYVHRPFIYAFLFTDRTAALQLAQFYKSLHQNLLPIHRPLLASTGARNVHERIEAFHNVPPDTDASSTASTTKKGSDSGNDAPIYELIYDPRTLTLYSSIPNIPEPGTPAAEGLASSAGKSYGAPPWTRIEALNVHSQILATVASVKHRNGEIERTSRTSRGWWVVWMKVRPSTVTAPVATADHATGQSDATGTSTTTLANETTIAEPTAVPPSSQDEDKNERDMHRIALLVRRAKDPSSATAAAKQSSASGRAMSEMFNAMTLGLAGRSEEDKIVDAGSDWGPGALAGGIGIDARAYIENLLSLNR